MTWYLWMLAGAGAQTVITGVAGYALRARIRRRLTVNLQAELAKILPVLPGLPRRLDEHGRERAAAAGEPPPGAIIQDPTQAQMRSHKAAL